MWLATRSDTNRAVQPQKLEACRKVNPNLSESLANPLLQNYGEFKNVTICDMERHGIVVEHQTLKREVLGLIPTGGTTLCP